MSGSVLAPWMRLVLPISGERFCEALPFYLQFSYIFPPLTTPPTSGEFSGTAFAFHLDTGCINEERWFLLFETNKGFNVRRTKRSVAREATA